MSAQGNKRILKTQEATEQTMRLNMLVGNNRKEKRQRTAALQDALALSKAVIIPPGFGVRQSSAALAPKKMGSAWR